MDVGNPGEVGRLVTAARERAGLSKAELSRRSMVDAGHIGRLERGEIVNPRLGMIEALAVGLGLGEGLQAAGALLSGRLPRPPRKGA
jgi:transcriptional regulator with XRE-family HTH domain